MVSKAILEKIDSSDAIYSSDIQKVSTYMSQSLSGFEDSLQNLKDDAKTEETHKVSQVWENIRQCDSISGQTMCYYFHFKWGKNIPFFGGGGCQKGGGCLKGGGCWKGGGCQKGGGCRKGGEC